MASPSISNAGPGVAASSAIETPPTNFISPDNIASPDFSTDYASAAAPETDALTAAAESFDAAQASAAPLDDTAAAMQAEQETFAANTNNLKDGVKTVAQQEGESLASQGAQDAGKAGLGALDGATDGALSHAGNAVANTAGQVAANIGSRVGGTAATEGVVGAAEGAMGAVAGAAEGALAAAGPVGWIAGGALALGLLFADIFGHKDFQADVAGATKSHQEDSDKIDASMQAVSDDQSNNDGQKLAKDQKNLAHAQKSERGDNQRAYVDANKEEDGIRKQSVNVQTDINDHSNDSKRLDKDKKNLQSQETKILSKAGSDPNAKALAQKAIDAGIEDVQLAQSNGTSLKKSQNNFFTNETHGKGDKSGDLDPYSATLADLAENSATLKSASNANQPTDAVSTVMNQLRQNFPDQAGTGDPADAALREGVYPNSLPLNAYAQFGTSATNDPPASAAA